MKILPEDITIGQVESVASQDSARVVRRENRIKIDDPIPDRVEVEGVGAEPYPVGSDMELNYEVFTDFGTEGFIQRLDADRTVVDEKGPLTGTGSVTFTNLQQTNYIIRSFVVNSNGLRVSALVDLRFIVGDGLIHPRIADGTYPWADPGSEVNQLLVTIDQQLEAVQLENEVAGHVFDVLTGYDDEIDTVETHVSAIVGLSYSPVDNTEFQNSSQAIQSRFFPQTHREPEPLRIQASDPLPYSDSAKSGSEKEELIYTLNNYSQDGSEGDGLIYPATVTDTTREIDYEYDNDAQVQERIDEIDDLINGGPLDVVERDGISELATDTNGFNNISALQDLYDAVYHWLNWYSHRGFGRKFRARMNEKGAEVNEDKFQQIKNDQETTYGAGS